MSGPGDRGGLAGVQPRRWLNVRYLIETSQRLDLDWRRKAEGRAARDREVARTGTIAHIGKGLPAMWCGLCMDLIEVGDLDLQPGPSTDLGGLAATGSSGDRRGVP
jgi:hypothetical protein